MTIIVSEAIDGDTAEIVQLLRSAIGTRSNGRYIPGDVAQPVNFIASVQQPSGKELEKLPEGERDKDIMKFISIIPLHTTNDREALIADIVVRRGIQYKIIYSEDWDVFGQTTSFGARLTTENYIVPTPLPPVMTCAYLDNTFWESFGDIAVQWEPTDEYWYLTNLRTGWSLQAINGWNDSSFRPTTLSITINASRFLPEVLPTSIDIFLRTATFFEIIAAGVVVFENVTDSVSIDIPIDWDAIGPTGLIGTLSFFMDVYSTGPNVTCINFSGA